jgi:hypothetical protein
MHGRDGVIRLTVDVMFLSRFALLIPTIDFVCFFILLFLYQKNPDSPASMWEEAYVGLLLLFISRHSIFSFFEMNECMTPSEN